MSTNASKTIGQHPLFKDFARYVLEGPHGHPGVFADTKLTLLANCPEVEAQHVAWGHEWQYFLAGAAASRRLEASTGGGGK